MGEWALDKSKQTDSKKYRQHVLSTFIIMVLKIFCEIFKHRIIRILVDETMKKVHNDVLNSIMTAPVNLFFDVTPNGSIMKRFSSDMGMIEVMVHSFERILK